VKCARPGEPASPVAAPESVDITSLASIEARSTVASVATTGPTSTTKVFAQPARETARPLDVPDEVQGLFDLLDQRDHGVEQERETHRAEQRALHVLDESHDARRERVALRAERPQELVEHGFELAVVTEGLERGEGDCDQRHDGEESREHEAHRAQAEFAAAEIAQERVQVPERRRRPVDRAHAGRFRKIEEPAFDLAAQRGEDLS
jgi:hypothetical protein